MHDTKPSPSYTPSVPLSSVDKSQISRAQNSQTSILEPTYTIQKANEFHSSSSSGNCINYSPLGPRCYSPSEAYEANKYQRIDIKSEFGQQQQQHLSVQQQQQLQLLHLQQQRQQLHLQQQLQQQQYQQYQLQQERQQLHLIQQQQQQLLQCHQVPSPPIASAIPRPPINISTHHQTPNYDYRHDILSSSSRDNDFTITPGLFDRIAFAHSPRALPVAQTSSIQKYNDRIVLMQPSNQVTQLDTRQNTNINHQNENNIYNSNVTHINNVNIHVNAMNNNTNNYGDFANVNNDNNGNNNNYCSNNSNNNNSINNSNNHSATSSVSGGFIDFDESIFEDWMSEETEMDFIEGSEESAYKSSYDFLSKGCSSTSGCGPSASFCTGNTGQNACHPSVNDCTSFQRSSSHTHTQSTNPVCCGFSTGCTHHSIESRRPNMITQNIQPQPQLNNQLSKAVGFSGAVRSLGGRFCGPNHIDNSYQALEYNNDAKIFPGGQSQQIQMHDRTLSPVTILGSNHYDHIGVYKGNSDTIPTGVSTRNGIAGSFSQNYNNIEGQARGAFNSYFASTASVATGHNSTNSNSGTGPGSGPSSSTPYMNPNPNPIYRFVSATHQINNISN